MRISGKTILIVGVLIAVCYWGFFLGGFSMFQGSAGDATLQVQTNDALGEVVFSPAGASVKVWDSSGTYLGPLTESATYDGKWESAFSVPINTVVILKVEDSGSTYYTRQVERLVKAPEPGTDRVSLLDAIDCYPRSATSASDMVGTIMTAGVEVDNSTGIASGETDLMFSLTAASGKTWGGQAYHDYETGDDYIGAFMVFELTTTTARGVFTNYDYHFKIGSVEYWIFKLPQIHNDADIDDDGTYTFTIHCNNLVAGANALDIGLYTNAVYENVMASSFGTNDVGSAQAELWLNIAFS